MSRLKCDCLNITIHVQGSGTRETEGKSLVSETCSHVFFSGNLLEVELAVGGITKEVESLIRKSRVEDWDIYNCLNCGTEAFALHAVKGYDRVLVNRSLESNPQILKDLTNVKDFSPAFKIVLCGQQEKHSSDEGNAVLNGQEYVTVAMSSVQDQLKKYIKAEEAAMDERIRQYTIQQQEMFTNLQSQAFKHKTAIYRALNRAEEISMENSLHEAMLDTSEKHEHLFKAPVHAGGLQVAPEKPVSQVYITQVNAERHTGMFDDRPSSSRFTGVNRRRPQKVLQKSTKPSTADANPMFALDGFTDDCEPFFESEEDEMSSDNSFQSEELAIPHHMHVAKKKVQYSSSVPITMPMGDKTSHSWEDEEGEITIPEPSKIGESMKALARSVQNNTVDMFGELPRPRVFTESRLSALR